MSQQFSIMISASAQKTQAHLTAIKFVKALIQQQRAIRSIFFYQDAVSVANQFNSPPSDEPQLATQWRNLANDHGIELQACIAASYRRGILDEHQAQERKLPINNMQPGFKMTGLGQLAAAMSDKSVKLVHFK